MAAIDDQSAGSASEAVPHDKPRKRIANTTAVARHERHGTEHDERLETIAETLDELKELNRALPVIVEGEKDVQTLRALGLGGEIIKLHKGQSLAVFCETIAREHDKVIIMTDWDAQGGELCRMLREILKANDVRYDTELRAKLAMCCKKEIKDVEGLCKYMRHDD